MVLKKKTKNNKHHANSSNLDVLETIRQCIIAQPVRKDTMQNVHVVHWRAVGVKDGRIHAQLLDIKM